MHNALGSGYLSSMIETALAPTSPVSTTAIATPHIVRMTNADIEECAALQVRAADKRSRLTRFQVAEQLAQALTQPEICAFVWRDACCQPIAFAIGRCVGDCYRVSQLCAPSHRTQERLGLRLLQHIQDELGSAHVEIDASNGASSAMQLLRAL
jgi:hypothetical protein